MPSPRCPLDVDEVRGFAEHQKKLTADGRAYNPKKLLSPLAKWNPLKIRCLAFTLMAASEAAKKDQGYEPIHLLQSLGQTASIIMKDPALRTIYALRLFERAQYAETLRVLVHLQDVETSYRLPYEMVQRIYSLRQKGQGQVALKGL